MKELKPLKIGNLVVKKPIIQGGMGVGISLSSLAGAVAKAGGVGIISTAQIGFREPDFDEDAPRANRRAIGKEMKKARAIAPDGVIGFNIMVACKQYEEHVKAAVKAGADIIISGAGLPVELPKFALEAEMEERETAQENCQQQEHEAVNLYQNLRTKLAPIVSSVKSAMVICKMWDRKYNMAPDLVVIEGPLAGGHLGFSREQLTELGADTADVEQSFKKEEYDQEIRGIIKLVKEIGEKYQKEIPVVVAGGVYTHEDVMHQVELGADGVQVATRFVTTEECDAPMAYKQAYINAKKEDIVITKSPVGMPGRAIVNPFLESVKEQRRGTKHCHVCLHKCNPAQTPYCITDALIAAAEGKIDQALLFCGSNAFRASKIETVPEVMDALMGIA